MAFSSTPFSLSDDFCTQSYSADDIVALKMSYAHLSDPNSTTVESFETLLNLNEFVVVRNWLIETIYERKCCAAADRRFAATDKFHPRNLSLKNMPKAG